MRKDKFEKEMVKLNFLIEKDLLKEYKLFCLKKDITMSDSLRALIRNEIDKNQ